jgi:hypothetical protein
MNHANEYQKKGNKKTMEEAMVIEQSMFTSLSTLTRLADGFGLKS